jgi:methionyl aminopeptidase
VPKQSSPPRIPVSELFPNGLYPVGDMQPYKDDNLSRTTGEEERYLARRDNMSAEFLRDYREAAEVCNPTCILTSLQLLKGERNPFLRF